MNLRINPESLGASVPDDDNTYYCQKCGVPFIVPTDWEHEYAGCTNCNKDSKVSDLKKAEKRDGDWIAPSAFLLDRDNPPLQEDGTPMVTFETKQRKRDDGTIEKAVFIDGEQLDWSVDTSSLMEAMKMGPKFYRSVQKDIEKHYVDSVSEFIGRKVTPNEIKRAIQNGWI